MLLAEDLLLLLTDDASGKLRTPAVETDIALGGVGYFRLRPAATNACAIIWPPNVRTGFLLGWAPEKVFSSRCSRCRIASSSSKSASDSDTNYPH